MRNDSQTAAPATSPAAPSSEKMPAPTMAPTPMNAACRIDRVVVASDGRGSSGTSHLLYGRRPLRYGSADVTDAGRDDLRDLQTFVVQLGAAMGAAGESVDLVSAPVGPRRPAYGAHGARISASRPSWSCRWAVASRRRWRSRRRRRCALRHPVARMGVRDRVGHRRHHRRRARARSASHPPRRAATPLTLVTATT